MIGQRYAHRVHGEIAGEFDRFAVMRRIITAIELDSQDDAPDFENMRHLASMLTTTVCEHIESVQLKKAGG